MLQRPQFHPPLQFFQISVVSACVGEIGSAQQAAAEKNLPSENISVTAIAKAPFNKVPVHIRKPLGQNCKFKQLPKVEYMWAQQSVVQMRVDHVVKYTICWMRQRQ